MNLLSHDQRVDALCRLETAGDHRSSQTLRTIDRLLISPDHFSNSDLKRILEKREYPLQVERAIKLYAMMARLMRICEPKGETIGPACAVRLINFERLTFQQALDLRNGIGFRLAFEPTSSFSKFCGLDLLNSEEKELYRRIKPYFEGRKKPTLKILAARLLRTEDDESFSDRAVLRYIKTLKNYDFTDQHVRRDFMIRSVDSFGAHNQSTRESLAYAIAQAAESFNYAMAQAAVQFRQSIPIITQQIIPQISNIPLITRQIIVQISNVPQTVSLLAQSMAQIPNVIARIAELYQFIPQAFASLANLNQLPKVRQT